MATELEEYYQELFQEIQSSADARGEFVEDEFFRIVSDQVVEAGELDTADRVQYAFQRGSISIRIDGYGGDPATGDGVLSLIVADFNQSNDLATLTATDMNAHFRRLEGFLTRSLNSEFREEMEETASASGLAELIAARWDGVLRVRLFLLTNRVLSGKVDGRAAGEIEGIPISYSVWDLGRLHRFVSSGQGREDIVVDLAEEFGGSIPALPAHLDEAGYEAYLAVISGSQLAEIYGRWGARLLEQNVRVFLQARGNVNRGIRNTLENDPVMFFAYNNGITATAEAITTNDSKDQLALTSMTNFQIVNGGQTTASVYAASRNKDVDLSRVFIQMKLSIVDPAKAEEIVPKISEYANTQNRVNAADFFANHPFHVRVEQFSRRLYAPSPDGSFRESKWFYERARGQYQDARGNLTDAERRRFDLEYPKAQLFSKTDLAKFLNVWQGLPHIVSQGAQKNFVNFADATGKQWAKSSDEFNEAFYRHAMAKAIIFKGVEKLVTDQPWYEGGYRANVVAYAIAKLADHLQNTGGVIDFERIWRDQGMSPDLTEALTVSAKGVHDVIIDTPPTSRNVTEWAKQQACWSRVQRLEIEWPAGLNNELLTKGEQRDARQAAVKEQRVDNGIGAQMAVVAGGAILWRDVLTWGDSKGLLSEADQGILQVAASPTPKIPTEKQSERVIEILKRLRSEGCPLGDEIGGV